MPQIDCKYTYGKNYEQRMNMESYMSVGNCRKGSDQQHHGELKAGLLTINYRKHE